MDKETINDSENINSDEWKFLLLMMLTEDIKQKNSQWKYPTCATFFVLRQRTITRTTRKNSIL